MQIFPVWKEEINGKFQILVSLSDNSDKRLWEQVKKTNQVSVKETCSNTPERHLIIFFWILVIKTVLILLVNTLC